MVESNHHGNESGTDGLWCLVAFNRQLCTGESLCEDDRWQQFKTKERARGGITCPECLEMVREIKSVKL